MMMSHLLMLNPHHSVVFVVDRILLALQQTRVIRKELGDKLFNRYIHRYYTCVKGCTGIVFSDTRVPLHLSLCYFTSRLY